MMSSTLPKPNLRDFFCITYILLCGIGAQAQLPRNDSPDYYNAELKRMLVIEAGNFINVVSQGQVDMDSAMIMACDMYGIDRIVPYNGGYDPEYVSAKANRWSAANIKAAQLRVESLKGTEKIRALFDLANYYLHKSGAQPQDLERAKLYIDQAMTLTGTGADQRLRNEALHLTGKLYFQRGDIAGSQPFFEQVVTNCMRSNDGSALAVALFQQAYHLPFGNPEKLRLFEKALALSQKHKMKVAEILTRVQIVTIHFSTSPVSTEKEALHLLQLRKALGFRHLHIAHNVLSYMYLIKTDYVNSLYHAQLAVKIMQQVGDRATASLHYMRLGNAYTFLFKIEEGLKWFQKSLDGPKSAQTQIFWYKSFLLKARYLIYLKRFDEALALIGSISKNYPPNNIFDTMHLAMVKGTAYEGLKQPQLADPQFKQFLALAENFPAQYIHYEFPEAHNFISLFYFEQGRFDESRALAQKAFDISAKMSSIPNLAMSYSVFFKLDSASGNYLSAIRNYQKFKLMADSSQNINQRHKYDELQVRYQTVKKDQDIKLLKQNEALQQARLMRSDYEKRLVIGAVIILLIFIGLLYYLFRLKQKSNIRLQQQQHEISEKNRSLEQLLTEKEWLLKEIHHRVKNNLQTVMSLMESQSAYLKNDALAAIQDSQHRVQAMSLIHQKLYLTENVTTINMQIYIQELVGYLQESFDTRQRIRFQLDLEPISLDIAQAIPIGLILNETITNSIKYAFPDGREGLIGISISQPSEGHYELAICDNGVGLPPDFENLKTTSLGIRLMRGLSNEIGGQLRMVSEKGTVVSVSFTVENVFRKTGSIQKEVTELQA